MKQFDVKITREAKEDLKRYLLYIRDKLNNPQAVKNVEKDFRDTKNRLADIADSIAEPQSEILKARGLKRLNFIQHDYFMLFRLVDDTVEITNIFHSSEDYERKLT